MEIILNREGLMKSLTHVQGVIEKRSTLPILSNVLIEASSSKLKLTSTDLDIIFIEEINDLKVIKEGSTTTSATVLYDIVRKFPSNSKIEIKLISDNKLELKSHHSKFNLLCLSPSNFPLSNENFNAQGFDINSNKLLKLINKTKFSISSDDTRHYLSGIFFHKRKLKEDFFLTAVATDSHRMSLSNLKLDDDIDFESIIIPKKTIFQLSSLLESSDKVKIYNNKSKIKFEFNNSVLISKLIDGKFPNYNQVIPSNNDKILEINLKDFVNSVDRVTSVSSDRKEGVKLSLSQESLKLSVNSPNSGDGTEIIKSKFNSEEMNISFNSKYLIDVASQIEGDVMIFNLKDVGSPALITDLSDPDSQHVIMPMKV